MRIIGISCTRKKVPSGPNKTLRLFQASSHAKPLRRGIGQRQVMQFSCTPMQVLPSYPGSLSQSAFQPFQTLRPPRLLHHDCLSSQHHISLQQDSPAPDTVMPYEGSVGQGTDTRRREDYGHTYTHAPPISKREIGLTPHSPSG